MKAVWYTKTGNASDVLQIGEFIMKKDMNNGNKYEFN